MNITDPFAVIRVIKGLQVLVIRQNDAKRSTSSYRIDFLWPVSVTQSTAQHLRFSNEATRDEVFGHITEGQYDQHIESMLEEVYTEHNLDQPKKETP